MREITIKTNKIFIHLINDRKKSNICKIILSVHTILKGTLLFTTIYKI